MAVRETHTEFVGYPAEGHFGVGDRKVARLVAHTLPTILNLAVPGFLEGRVLSRSYQENPFGFVPGDELADRLLYLGKGNIDGLKDHVLNQLDLLGVEYTLKSKNHGLDEVGLNIQPVKVALDAVEAFYSERMRRTGEASEAHEYRVLARGIDFLRNSALLVNKGESILVPFKAEPAVVFLTTLVLHDFCEDVIQMDERVVREGKITYESELQGGHRQSGLLLSIVDRELETGEAKEIYSTQLPGFGLSVDYLFESLRALNTVGGARPDTKLRDSELSMSERFGGAGFVPRSFRFGPFLAKQFDRNDNLATRTFVGSDGGYAPANVEGIYQKAMETLEFFGELEARTAFSMTNYRRLSQTFMDLSNIVFRTSLMQGGFRGSVVSLRPTLWAKLTLLGWGPERIYRSCGEGILGLPLVDCE